MPPRHIFSRNYRRKRRYETNHQSRDTGETSLEIPGFSFDPIRKCYFRIFEDPISQNWFKSKLNTKKPPTISTAIKGGYLDLFSHRQLNLVNSYSFVDRFLRLKLSRMKRVYSCDLNREDSDYPVVDCKYLIGCPESSTFITACTLKSGGCLVQSFSLKSNDNLHVKYENISSIRYCEKVTDLCIMDVQFDKQYVLSTSIDYTPQPECLSSVNVTALSHLSNYPGTCAVYEHVSHRNEDSLLWSCAWNKETKCYAFGGECLLNTVNIDAPNQNRIACKENCFSLDYNTCGNQLFVGSIIGNLCCVDLRHGKFTSSKNFGRGSSYIKLLNDENFIIASLYDGKLLQIDLRTWKPILEYPDHANSHLKLPFSIDEGANVLCSVGQDGITRLWSLKEGKLLHFIDTDNDNSASGNQPMAWYSTHWQVSPQKCESCLVMTTDNNVLLYK